MESKATPRAIMLAKVPARIVGKLLLARMQARLVYSTRWGKISRDYASVIRETVAEDGLSPEAALITMGAQAEAKSRKLGIIARAATLDFLEGRT